MRRAPWPPENRLPAAYPSHSAVILVVDDEPVARRSARLILEHAGHRVWEASGASEALRLLESRRPLADLLLTDIVMPGMNGIALAAEAHRRWPGLHVLFMSGFTREFADELSGSICVSKPFRASELVGAVESALGPKTAG